MAVRVKHKWSSSPASCPLPTGSSPSELPTAVTQPPAVIAKTAARGFDRVQLSMQHPLHERQCFDRSQGSFYAVSKCERAHEPSRPFCFAVVNVFVCVRRELAGCARLWFGIHDAEVFLLRNYVRPCQTNVRSGWLTRLSERVELRFAEDLIPKLQWFVR